MVTVSTKCFWRDRMHPAPITAAELKLHQLNFGWSRNKTIRSNNTRVQPAPEGLCQLLQCHESPRHSIVQSHRSCPDHPGPTGPLSQPVPRGPHRGWSSPAQLRQLLLLLVHFGKELGGFPNASAWQLIPAIPVMHSKSVQRKFKACIPIKFISAPSPSAQHLLAADNAQSGNFQ